MANNQDFLESYLPTGHRTRKTIKEEWQAFRETEATETGVLCDEENLSSDLTPALLPSPKPVRWRPRTKIGTREGTFAVWGEAGGIVSPEDAHYTVPLALFCAEDKLIVFHNSTRELRSNSYFLDIISEKIILRLNLCYLKNMRGQDVVYDRSIFTQRRLPAVFPHNLVTDLQAITQSEWNSYLMILPGFLYLPREIYLGMPKKAVGPNAWCMEVTEQEDGTLTNVFYKSGTDTWQEKGSFPIYLSSPGEPAYATRDRWGISHMGRIFAAGDGVVSATNYNSLSRTLDTADEYREGNGWAALLSSRAEGEEEVTGIAAYRSHVVVFKKHFMHEITGSKNPFRVVDVGAVGCIDSRSVCEVDGTLFFVSEDGVRAYTGDSLPRLISEPLKIKEFHKAVAGRSGHKYYLWGTGCQRGGEEETFFYVYDARYGVWTKEKSPAESLLGFAETSFGFFALGSDGYLYRMDSGEYESQTWFAETALVSDQNVDVKHLYKAELFLEATPGSALSVYLLKDGEAFSPLSSRRVYSHTFSEGGQKSVRFHVRRGAHVARKIVVAGEGKIILRHMKLYEREGGSGHATTPRE